MTLNVQLLTMAFMILGGFYLGIALETFRRFSSLWRHRPILVYTFEISFWLIQTFIIFYVLYRVNSGELRVYIFIACLLGFSIYQALAASLYRVILEFIIQMLTVFLRTTRRVGHVLIVSPIGWIIRTILMGVWIILWILVQLIFIALLPLKWLIQFVYYLLPQKIKKLFNKKVDFYSILKFKLLKWIDSIKGR